MTDESTAPIGATAGPDLSHLADPRLSDTRTRNAAEALAISHVYDKYIFRAGRKFSSRDWLSEELVRRLHAEMFKKIWTWAGKYRTVPVNIGMDWHQIPQQVQILCGDFKYWNSQESTMPVIEIAARLQNRLTRIHPFFDGNGRHARLITDIFFHSRKHPLPKWPQIQRMEQGDAIRKRYIAAMKSADQNNFSALSSFIEEFLK